MDSKMVREKLELEEIRRAELESTIANLQNAQMDSQMVISKKFEQEGIRREELELTIAELRNSLEGVKNHEMAERNVREEVEQERIRREELETTVEKFQMVSEQQVRKMDDIEK